jgi:hypothetical protein
VIGILLKAASDRVVEYSVQYDGPAAAAGDTVYNNIYSACHVDNGTVPRQCQITFTVAKEMTAPVYVYYELQNFYQNHRRYVKSRSDKQLSGACAREFDVAVVPYVLTVLLQAQYTRTRHR